MHAYLSSLPSLAGANVAEKEAVALRCLKAFGVEGCLPACNVVMSGDRFQKWVKDQYPDAVWHTEVHVTAPRAGGGQWAGSIDLLLVLPDGNAVIIDHKSAPIRRAQCEAKAQSYGGQLLAYGETITRQPLSVRHTWIHFPLAGMMVKLEEHA